MIQYSLLHQATYVTKTLTWFEGNGMLQQIRTWGRRGWPSLGGRRLPVMVVLLGALGLVRPSHAAEFSCAPGDVACLISAIHAANATGTANTMTLASGLYTLTAVDNNTDGPNGLPSVTGSLTLRGAGADMTILERAAG